MLARKNFLSLNPNAPDIFSLSTWMKDLKSSPSFGNQKLGQIVLPGVHHAGQTNAAYNDTFMAHMFDELNLQGLYK